MVYRDEVRGQLVPAGIVYLIQSDFLMNILAPRQDEPRSADLCRTRSAKKEVGDF